LPFIFVAKQKQFEKQRKKAVEKQNAIEGEGWDLTEDSLQNLCFPELPFSSALCACSFWKKKRKQERLYFITKIFPDSPHF
jgi:hypothetical protein